MAASAGLERREEQGKVAAEWRRVKTSLEQHFAGLQSAKSAGLAVKARMEADPDTFSADDVASGQELIDYYQAEKAKL